MKRAFAPLALIALAAAPAQADTPKGWERVTSPDGKFSVATPCKASDVEVEELDGGWLISCEKGDLSFRMVNGMPDPDTSKVRSFDEVAQVAGGALPDDLTIRTPVLGRRTVGLRCSDLRDVACVVLVDTVPGRPLGLAVTGKDGVGTAGTTNIASNSADARQFYASVTEVK